MILPAASAGFHLCYTHHQSVVLDGTASGRTDIVSGAGLRHGIILGPLLFTVYINDLPCNLKSKLHRFANDCISSRLEYGVLQGSVLGPLLFVLCTSHVPRVFNECVLLSVIYADVMQIYIQVKPRDFPFAKVRVEDCIVKV